MPTASLWTVSGRQKHKKCVDTLYYTERSSAMIFQAGFDGLTFVSQKDQDSIKTICRTVIIVTAMIVAGKWAVMGIAGIVLLKTILDAGE